ncbi:hypothetical protein PYCC9005_000690 [Savitreella phatthalungensis]
MEVARHGYRYASQYCEENIYHLANDLLTMDGDVDASVVFISNRLRRVPFFSTVKHATTPDRPLIWDYHVILVTHSECGVAQVFDFDASTVFPTPWQVYRSVVLRTHLPLLEDFRRMYRVIPARRFLETFASDRSHMLDPCGDGTYFAPIPNWPLIRGTLSVSLMTLHALIQIPSFDTSDDSALGRVMTEDEFVKWMSEHGEGRRLNG